MRELGTKAERVGNFRLFRTYAQCGAKERVDALKVTNLEGSWGVIIPATFVVYKIIVDLFRSEDDKDVQILHTLFCNWYSVTCIADGEFHLDIIKAQESYVSRMNPELDEKEEEEAISHAEMSEEMRQYT